MKKILTLTIALVISTLAMQAQNVGIGTTSPLMDLHVSSADSAVMVIENKQALNANTSNAMYFKTGSGPYPYTGAIKTIGESASSARLGLFTYASTSPNQLLERLSINDVGNIGIGTTKPQDGLHVNNKNVVFTSTVTSAAPVGAPSVNGPGYRTVWYSDKAAFRTGYTDGPSWDMANVGINSFAAGNDNVASGSASFAMGWSSTASGAVSTAFGIGAHASGFHSVAFNGDATGDFSFASNGYATGDRSISMFGHASGIASIAIGDEVVANTTHAVAIGSKTLASGVNSTAIGNATIASAENATAMGVGTTASGTAATALGSTTIASGYAAVATGFNNTASGDFSTAMGRHNTASGDYTTAIGKDVSTNGFEGCVTMGDAANLGVMNCVRTNEFRARFIGGYTLYSSGIGLTGVYMLGGSNAWSSVSDSTKKERFKKADGEYVLNSISKMKLGSWNYKKQDAATFRHYGPMAQEFYSAFGNDGIGKVGCDTLINSADIDGVMMIGLQALEKRSSELAVQNKLLTDRLAALEMKLNEVLAAKK